MLARRSINYVNNPQISAQWPKKAFCVSISFAHRCVEQAITISEGEVRFCPRQARGTQADRGPALQPMQGYQGGSRCRKGQEAADITSGHVSLARS